MMTPEPGDDLKNETIIEEWDTTTIIERALEYPFKQTKELYYPAKSYAIATTYAILLSKYFDGNISDYLSDPELLAGNDPYFKTYDEASLIYDNLIVRFLPMLRSSDGFWDHSENYKRTLDYFHKEFLLAEDTKQWLPAN
jgi:hypothetical protein